MQFKCVISLTLIAETARMKSIIAAVISVILVVSHVNATPISPFVVNGTDAQIDEFPFIVSFAL